MKLNFKDILTEQNSPKNEKFINMLVGEMKKSFESKYRGTHWASAASFVETISTDDYRGAIDTVKKMSVKSSDYIKKFSMVDKLTPKGVSTLMSEFREVQKSYMDALHTVSHLKELFGDYSKVSFIDKYAIPSGVLIDVWERFRDEILPAGKIDYNKTKDGLSIEYGLPENGDYTEPKYYNSQNRDNFYVVFKDGEGNFILGIDQGLSWESNGINLDELYHKTYSSMKDLANDISMMEMATVKNEFYGAEIDLDDEETNILFNHIDSLNMDDIQGEANEDQTTFDYTLGEEINHYGYNQNGFNIGNRDGQYIAKNYLSYKEVMDQFPV